MYLKLPRAKMSQPPKSPSYNILAPKPWTSFKETPPSPLLVLQRRDSRSGRAGEEGRLEVRTSLKKKRAPQPPVRASSLSSPVSDDEADLDQKHPAENNATETEDVGLEESVTTGMVTGDTEGEDNVDDVDANKHPKPELILDVQKLEDLADNIEAVKKESSEDVDDITEPFDSVDEKLSTGNRLSIVGLSGFIEGLLLSFPSDIFQTIKVTK